MNKIKNLLLLAALCAIVGTGCTNVRHVGNINGLDVTRVTTRGVFSPATTSVVLSDPTKPGSIDSVIANAGGPGVLPAVATAAGVAGGAALLRPSRTTVNGGNSSSSSTGGSASSGSISSGGNTQNGAIHHNN